MLDDKIATSKKAIEEGIYELDRRRIRHFDNLLRAGRRIEARMEIREISDIKLQRRLRNKFYANYPDDPDFILKMEKVGDKVIDTISETEDIAREKLNLEREYGSLGIDSLSVQALALDLGDYFEIDIDDDRAQELLREDSSLGEIVNYIALRTTVIN